MLFICGKPFSASGIGSGESENRRPGVGGIRSPDPLASDPVWRSLLWSSQNTPGRALIDPALYFIPEAPGHLCDLGEQVPGPPEGRG